MSYQINYLNQDRVAATEPWAGTLDDAKALGIRAVDGGSVERVEIRDGGSKLVFRYP